MSTPAPWQPGWQPTTTPVPTPAPVGTNSFGPAGWVALGGIVLNGVIYGLQQSVSLIPQPWGNVVLGGIALLTVLGIYRAPSHVLSSVPTKSVPVSRPDPAPVAPPPAPAAPPRPVLLPPTPPPAAHDATLSEALEHVAEGQADAREILDDLRKTIGD